MAVMEMVTVALAQTFPMPLDISRLLPVCPSGSKGCEAGCGSKEHHGFHLCWLSGSPTKLGPDASVFTPQPSVGPRAHSALIPGTAAAAHHRTT